MEQLTVRVVDDDVVLHFISEQDDVTFTGADDAVAVLDWRLGAEDSPIWNQTVFEIALAEDGFLSTENGGEGCSCRGGGEEVTARKGALEHAETYSSALVM
ncbi:hypothetical protein [Rubritalea profundi]|uniref:hypothetical protein n=1 Tax=Rubritalea profundi TaxID=1658618 RepID=UPI0013FD6729|nr:hypothetical protein [Rubritalea profundi]